MRNGGKNLGPSQDGFFSIKLTKNPKKNKGEMFCTFADMTSLMLNSKFVTLHFLKSDQTAIKICIGLFLHKINKNMPWKQGWSLRTNDSIYWYLGRKMEYKSPINLIQNTVTCS